MENNMQLKAETYPQIYASPQSREILVDTQGVICTSETEIVGETEGIW